MTLIKRDKFKEKRVSLSGNVSYPLNVEDTDGLFEIRVQLASDIFRIFGFFDEGQLIVLANGFQKKTQKTPKKN